MVLHDDTILMIGGIGNHENCLQLDLGTWKDHSTLTAEERICHSAVATQTATFVFGGTDSLFTYEYLPKGSNTWLKGKTEIPGGFRGCAIAVKSGEEILLFGECEYNEKRILSFDVKNHTFRELSTELNVERSGRSRCAYIPNTNKIMITGGIWDDSTEILDTEDESVTMASPMNANRSDHGMGVLTINGEDRLAVFGGTTDEPFKRDTVVDSVELYNAKTGKWETTDMKLTEAKEDFGFLELKLTKNVRKNLKFLKTKPETKNVGNERSMWSFCNLL